jgi:hypothetical protein
LLLKSWDEANIKLAECFISVVNRIDFVEIFDAEIFPEIEDLVLSYYGTGDWDKIEKVKSFGIYKDILNLIFKNHKIIRIHLNDYYEDNFMYLQIEFLPTGEILEKFDFDVIGSLRKLVKKYKALYEGEKKQLTLF